MRLPLNMEAGTVITKPVGHIDIFATMMDYLDLSDRDRSDGKSLRPWISGEHYRRFYEDEYAVSEEDPPADGKFAKLRNFMVRHGSWKLMIVKLARSRTPDALYNLETDPFEQTNLLSPHLQETMTLTDVGKAEHLKCLLLEWLYRRDGSVGWFSDPTHNSLGRGDILEIMDRRSWPTVDQWFSDSTLTLPPPVFVQGKWRSNVYLYTGRTTAGALRIHDVQVTGNGSEYATVSDQQAILWRNEYGSIRIAFASSTAMDMRDLDLQVTVMSNVYSRYSIPILT